MSCFLSQPKSSPQTGNVHAVARIPERGAANEVNWPGIVAVALIVIAITAYKIHTKHATVAGADGPPTVLLVADLSEADSERCLRGDHSFGTGSA